jgi:hypothetical protein
VTESLEQTEMRLLHEAAANNNVDDEDQNSNNILMNMPASCHSILKVGIVNGLGFNFLDCEVFLQIPNTSKHAEMHSNTLLLPFY